jgi:hypothetical protein
LTPGEVARILEIAALSGTYRGYVWAQWLRQNMTQMLALFAALLGTGGLLSQASGGGALFTLSLPASRDRLLGVRAATGLAELLALAFLPSLVLPLLSPVVGETFSFVDVLAPASARSSRLPSFSAATGCRRLQRRLAAGVDRLPSPPASDRRAVHRRLLALRSVRLMDGDCTPRGWIAVAGPARQRGGVGGDAVRASRNLARQDF